MAAIDYGAIVFKNKKRYKSDYLFPIIDELGVFFYKTAILDCDGNLIVELCTSDKKVFYFDINDAKYRVKEICDSVYMAQIYKGENKFFCIFGYGIDNDKDCWDKIKVEFLGKKNSKKIDKILKHFNDYC